jgi:hypothetical protein
MGIEIIDLVDLAQQRKTQEKRIQHTAVSRLDALLQARPEGRNALP